MNDVREMTLRELMNHWYNGSRPASREIGERHRRSLDTVDQLRDAGIPVKYGRRVHPEDRGLGYPAAENAIHTLRTACRWPT